MTSGQLAWNDRHQPGTQTHQLWILVATHIRLSAALAFDDNGLISYVVYNLSGQALVVTFSDGHIVNTAPYEFTVTTN